MDINMFQPADTAVATMRTLPWLTTSSTGWRQLPVRSRALVPAEALDHATSMPAVGAYCVSGVSICGARARITQDQSATVLVATGADHKFSTRLGPSASPPV